MVVTQGYHIYSGNTASIFDQKGEFVRPRLRDSALSPNNVLKNKLRDGRARHGMRVPCQRLKIEFEAVWGTWERLPRAHFVYTPKWLISRGVTLYPQING